MAEKGTIFEQIKEKMDEMIMGRRYLISEMGKLKVTVDKMAASIPNVGDLEKWLGEVKNAVSSMSQLGPLMNSLADSAGSIQRMDASVNKIEKSILGMTDLSGISTQISQSAQKIGGLSQSIIDMQTSIRGLEELKEGFEAALGIMGELKITMGGLKTTMDTLTGSFEGIAGLADLGKLAKTLKPSIDELRETMSSVSGLKGTLDDIRKSAQSMGDLKLIIPELKASMGEIRTTVSSLKSGVGVQVGTVAPPPVSVGKPVGVRPIAKPISTPLSTSETPKTITGVAPIQTGGIRPSTEPLKAGRVGLTAKPIGDSKSKGKTPPIVTEVFDLIVQRAERGETAIALAKLLENGRDTISKSWKWHPTLYEVGTFARKLRKYPEGKQADESVIKVLFQKIEEWKTKMVDEK
ncbi:MAG: hypothetical protein EAX96_08400 [Candidatus Lokiarchaeota archaeon]|nr:hypothetical protein [Candidatus Lokiarchaeota archaeon]